MPQSLQSHFMYTSKNLLKIVHSTSAAPLADRSHRSKSKLSFMVHPEASKLHGLQFGYSIICLLLELAHQLADLCNYLILARDLRGRRLDRFWIYFWLYICRRIQVWIVGLLICARSFVELSQSVIFYLRIWWWIRKEASFCHFNVKDQCLVFVLSFSISLRDTLALLPCEAPELLGFSGFLE